MSPLEISVCESDSQHSNIPQLDGNTSLISEDGYHNNKHCNKPQSPKNIHRVKNAKIAHHLPVVTVTNYRSFFPKIKNAKKDIFERQVDINLGCEVWQKAESKKHRAEIETMLELEGLKYFSTPDQGERGVEERQLLETQKDSTLSN